jgi:hypothetical protein
LISVL